MLTRTYFFSAKVAHNDGTGNYSWCHSITVRKGWREDNVKILKEIRDYCLHELSPKMDRSITGDDVELISLSRI